MRELEPAARPRAVRKPRGILVPFWLGYAFLYLPILVVVIMIVQRLGEPLRLAGLLAALVPRALRRRADHAGSRATRSSWPPAPPRSRPCSARCSPYGIQHYTRGGLIRAFAIAPAILPDLLLGIGLLTFFSLLSITLGLHSVILAHAVFAMAFVTAIVLARLANLDPSLEEASRDLGAGPLRTFMRVTLPAARPGHRRGRPARLHALDRRVRDRVLHHGAHPADPADRHLLDGALRRDARGQRARHPPPAREHHHGDRGATTDPTDRILEVTSAPLLRVDRVRAVLRRHGRPARHLARHRRQRVLRAARPVGLRQDHAAALDRRLRDARARAASRSTARTCSGCRRTSGRST